MRSMCVRGARQTTMFTDEVKRKQRYMNVFSVERIMNGICKAHLSASFCTYLVYVCVDVECCVDEVATKVWQSKAERMSVSFNGMLMLSNSIYFI